MSERLNSETVQEGPKKQCVWTAQKTVAKFALQKNLFEVCLIFEIYKKSEKSNSKESLIMGSIDNFRIRQFRLLIGTGHEIFNSVNWCPGETDSENIGVWVNMIQDFILII